MRFLTTATLTLATLTGGVSADVLSVPGDFPTVDAALAAANDGDTVMVASSVFTATSLVDFQGKAVTLQSTAGLVNTNELSGVVLANGSKLRTADAQGDLFLSGELNVPASAGASVNASGDEMYVDSLRLSAGADLNLTRDGARFFGASFRTVSLSDGSTLSANVVTLEDAQFLSGTSMLVDELYTSGVVVAENATVNVFADRGVGPAGESMTLGCCGAAGVSSWTVENTELLSNGGFFAGAGTLFNGFDSTLSFAGVATFDAGSELELFSSSFAAKSLVVRQGAQVELFDTSFSADALVNGGFVKASGELLASQLTNGLQGAVLFTDDALVGGNVENSGAMALKVGVVTVAGNFNNQGDLFADLNGSLAGGFTVTGDMTVGEDALLAFPSQQLTLEVKGSFECEVNESERFEMDKAAMVVGGNDDATFEVMSMDLGADLLGLDRSVEGNFPVGGLMVDGDVELVNEFYNSGAATEALYVEELVVSEGATLTTNGFAVYYTSLVMEGDVDNPANLVPMTGACPGDCNRNGAVDFNDLASMLFEMGTVQGVACDADRSGVVDFGDLVVAMLSFGSCN